MPHPRSLNSPFAISLSPFLYFSSLTALAASTGPKASLLRSAVLSKVEEASSSRVLQFSRSNPMGKPKQRKRTAKSTSQDGSWGETDFDGGDSWVVVKKQKITILIPMLPHSRKSTMPKPGPSEMESMPIKAVNDRSIVSIETSNWIPLAIEQEMVTPAPANRGIKTSTQIPSQNILALHKVPRVNEEIKSKSPNGLRASTSHGHNKLRASNTSKTIKQPKLFQGQRPFLLDGSVLLNQKLRASLLEKKLQKAGGLSRWLASIGLGQFVKIFQGRSVGKFQLVNLTMDKLKDMGADAVGPRRKLMHAIDCICQPYCFEAG